MHPNAAGVEFVLMRFAVACTQFCTMLNFVSILSLALFIRYLFHGFKEIKVLVALLGWLQGMDDVHVTSRMLC